MAINNIEAFETIRESFGDDLRSNDEILSLENGKSYTEAALKGTCKAILTKEFKMFEFEKCKELLLISQRELEKLDNDQPQIPVKTLQRRRIYFSNPFLMNFNELPEYNY